MFGIDDLALSLGIMAIAGGTGAAGVLWGGQSESNKYKAMAQANAMRAFLARRTADQNITLVKRNEEANITATQLDASQQAKNLREGVSRTIGTQKAVIAANGIGGGSVTAADIAADTFDEAKKDEIAIRYGADVKSANITNEANNRIWGINNDTANEIWGLDAQSAEYDMAAKNSRISSYINAGTSIMDSATSMARTKMLVPGSADSSVPGAVKLNNSYDYTLLNPYR